MSMCSLARLAGEEWAQKGLEPVTVWAVELAAAPGKVGAPSMAPLKDLGLTPVLEVELALDCVQAILEGLTECPQVPL